MADAYPSSPLTRATRSSRATGRSHKQIASRSSAAAATPTANRHRFAVQLCALRSLGRFVDDFAAAPVRIVNHVGRQLGLAPSLFITPPDRPATMTEHAQRIREYLGYQPFDDDAHARLKQLLKERAADGCVPASLLALAVSTLRAWKVEIPARSTLERLTSSAGARGEQAAWRRSTSA